MSLRVLSLVGPGFLALQDLAVTFSRQNELVAKIALEDLAMIVVDGPDLVMSHSLLSACAESKVVLVTSNEKHLPSGVLLPLAGHTTHTAILRQQIQATKPSIKRTWQTLVRMKILAQAGHVAFQGGDPTRLCSLAAQVRSGDPDNREAVAAALYFELIFGEDFQRERDAEGVNGLLNYGYAVLRAAVARAIVGAGLHPALGVHHQNQYNSLCLADDAMEPLRPLIDQVSRRILDEQGESTSVNPHTKRLLIQSLGRKVTFEDQSYPLLVALDRFGASLRRAICEGQDLQVPRIIFEE
ncbi:MAG: type II CRISPR-associated endonuclease Cas1 [Fimbriimonadaceae bacterium]|jgi:CRISPR-associated protein Cas1|nr:type II CRISPR-associated endonuclease Cas1 [Fimbriimonadaceae bacterium]